MKINICPICVLVGGTWLTLSFLVAWSYLDPGRFIIPIAILMGGSVVGIAYQGVQKIEWANKHPLTWKLMTIITGMPVSYALVFNLSKSVVILEFILLLLTAYFFFVEWQKKPRGSGESQKIRDIEKKMKQCC